MNIVADTNIFLAVALDETEKTNIIEVTSNANIISPEILPYEIGNALSAMIKRKRLSKDEAIKILEIVQNIPVRLLSVDIDEALQMAIEFNIYAYDAYFLSCAKSTSYPLLTLDKKMKQVAKELRIPLLLGE